MDYIIYIYIITWVVNHLPTGLHPPKKDTPTASNGSLKTLLSPWAGLPWEPHRGRQSM